jgi:hypothetical protein
MKYRNLWGPNSVRYRSRRIKLSPEDEEILRRRLARAEELRRRKFPEFYKD